MIVGFENITKNYQADLKEMLQRVVALNHTVAMAPGAYAALLSKWFGGNSGVAVTKIKAVDTYFTKKCSRITFVSYPEDHFVDGVEVEANDYGQVIPNVGTHVSSGLRVFVYGLYFRSKRYERINTVYHELTHKIIDTSDYRYGHNKCLAYSGSANAVKNADNYGYFMADLDRSQKGDLDISGVAALFG